jgi:hypothetical protein
VQNLMTVILSEVGVLNTGISSLINTNLWCYWVLMGSFTGRSKILFSSQICPDHF